MAKLSVSSKSSARSPRNFRSHIGYLGGRWREPRVHRLHAREKQSKRQSSAPYRALVRLSGLVIYPIKACAGIELGRSRVVARGLHLDRRYMLVDRSGTFITQREAPELCLVTTALDGDQFVVSAPGASALTIPQSVAAGADITCRIWHDTTSAIRHADGSRWFSEYLGDEAQLVYMPDAEERAVNPKRARPGDIVSFADAYPLLAVSEASLADLNARLDSPLSMQRFRPNLVLSECEPFDEDRLTTFAIGDVSLRAARRCERCVVTTIDPASGERGKEPLRTLARYRQEAGKVWFGMNLIHDGPGELRVGDAVRSL
jgi:uncharacterized protein